MTKHDSKTISISDSFYHYTWVVKANNVCVGTLKASEVINPYSSPLCFEIDGNKFTSQQLRSIADNLDSMNKKAAIFEASERLDEQQKRIKELEQENNNLKMPIELGDRITLTKKLLAIRDLEQQANGIEDGLSFLDSEQFKTTKLVGREALNEYSCVLREQAKQLKGGAN